MLLSVLAIILVFGAIVLVHEFGHMLAARSVGVVVPDFSIGMGPSLVSIKWGGTRFHLSAVPIGGYVRIAGMEGDSADAPGAPQDEVVYPIHATWQGKNGFQKAWMLVAGPLANFVLAFIVMLVMGFIGFPANAVMIGTVEPGMPAEQAGVLPDDIVLEIANREITSVSSFAAVIQEHLDEPVPLTVLRDNETLELTVTPSLIEGFNDDKASIGVALGEVIFATTIVALVPPKTVGYDLGIRTGDVITHVNRQPVSNGYEVFFSLAAFDKDFNPVDGEGNPLSADDAEPVQLSVERDGATREIALPGDTTLVSLGIQFQPRLEHLPLGESLLRSLTDAWQMFASVFFMLKALFTKVGFESITGPVGIVSLIGQSAHGGPYVFLQIVVLLNLVLGVINLLPLPALDGGRLVFVGLHGIGIHVPEKREAMIHALGMVMLLGLIGLITFTDILAFF
jgi:regulator of sigma E protease